MGMSVHIHLLYQPCPHSVTIIVQKPFRLDQAAICPQEKSLHGQRYGLEVGVFSSRLWLSCGHPPTAEHLFHGCSSRCKSSQHLPISPISPNPVSLDKTTFAFFLPTSKAYMYKILDVLLLSLQGIFFDLQHFTHIGRKK